MSEEERLKVAKERIEYVLKTYDVFLFQDDVSGDVKVMSNVAGEDIEVVINV